MCHGVYALVLHWGHNPKSDLAFKFNYQFIGNRKDKNKAKSC